MKKNLMKLMFVFSFLCIGLFVSEVNASTRFAKNIRAGENLSFKIGKSMSRSEIISKFNGKYVKLKKHCFNSCDDWISYSVVASDAMLAACDYHEDSAQCKAQQQNVRDVQDKTLAACANEVPSIVSRSCFSCF
ncbi:MAG: hypothetical protein ACR2N3_17755 [Pyrinomonadaceae bacterium]